MNIQIAFRKTGESKPLEVREFTTDAVPRAGEIIRMEVARYEVFVVTLVEYQEARDGSLCAIVVCEAL